MTDFHHHHVDYKDGRTRSISVSIYRDMAFKPCGTIFFNSLHNVAGFTYHPAYDGPPLDPVNLNYKSAGKREFAINKRTNNDLLHRVFVDYLPGQWGISILQAEYPEIKTLRAVERLHWFGTRTVGSLAFFVKHLEDEQPVHGIDLLESIRRRSVEFFMRRVDSLEASQWEMEGLASHGGARPKCMFSDKNGGQWLAKFNVDSDAYNYAKVEHAVALLARRCGINAVETRCVEYAPGLDMLFVRRFDKNEFERPHKISAFSLMREEIVRAYNEGDYRMLFEMLDTVCCDPEKAHSEMFRRMLFNIAVNNTDDHLKNFEVLLDPERNCYELSPAFDVTIDPYPTPRITSVFGLPRATLSDETLNHVLRGLDFPRDEAFRIRDEVAAGVAQWRPLFASVGIPEFQMKRVEKGMSYALAPDVLKGKQRSPAD